MCDFLNVDFKKLLMKLKIMEKNLRKCFLPCIFQIMENTENTQVLCSEISASKIIASIIEILDLKKINTGSQPALN